MPLLAPTLLVATLAAVPTPLQLKYKPCEAATCRTLTVAERGQLARAILEVVAAVPAPTGYKLVAIQSGEGSLLDADLQEPSRVLRHIPSKAWLALGGAFPAGFAFDLTYEDASEGESIKVEVELAASTTEKLADYNLVNPGEAVIRRGRFASRLTPVVDQRAGAVVGTLDVVLIAQVSPGTVPTLVGLAPVRLVKLSASGPYDALREMQRAFPGPRLEHLLPPPPAADEVRITTPLPPRKGDEFEEPATVIVEPPCSAATCRDLSQGERTALLARVKAALGAVAAPDGFSVVAIEAPGGRVTSSAELTDALLVPPQCRLSSRGCFPRPLKLGVVLSRGGAEKPVTATVSLLDRAEPVSPPASDASRYVRLANTPSFAAWAAAASGSRAEGEAPGSVHALWTRRDVGTVAPGQLTPVAQVKLEVSGPVADARKVYDRLNRNALEGVLGPFGKAP